MDSTTTSSGNQWKAAAGYLAIAIAPLLLVLGASSDKPYFAVGAVLTVYPLARLVFGPFDDPPQWTERVSCLLDRLPLLYAVLLAATLCYLLSALAHADLSAGDIVGWSLSLWVTLAFATCVAHDLLHRRGKGYRVAGHMLAGIAGYPVLGYDHSRHHARPGNTAAAEWPRIDESVWGFSARRLRAVLPGAIGRHGLACTGSWLSPPVFGLRIAVAATVTTWALFFVAAGWPGAIIYAVATVVGAFSQQLVTYMQHWGLGDDSVSHSPERGHAWEDDCRFEAWVTMNLSLHQAHHRQASLPYYRFGLADGAPRLPAGYVLMMFAAFVPAVWRRVMMPALEKWKAEPLAARSSGRRLTCVDLYR